MTASSHAMERCLALAALGYGLTKPNPMVGCVILRDGRVVGAGYHRHFGGPHAEIEALNEAGNLARGSTLVVNLEPCAHAGKTPPCVDAIIRAGIRNVIVAMTDPNPLVAGKGIRRLRRQGIDVSVGQMRTEALLLNESFVWFHTKQSPFVAAKWAQTLDGFSADLRGRSRWITGRSARMQVHTIRAGYDAILVGAKTVVADDPLLTVRHIAGRNPVRVVLDGALSVQGTESVFDTQEAPTMLVTRASSMKKKSALLRRLAARGVEILGIDAAGEIAPKVVLKRLREEGLTSLLVEGGTATTNGFLRARCVNLAFAFVHPGFLGGGTPSPGSVERTKVEAMRSLRVRDVRSFEEGDVLIEGELTR